MQERADLAESLLHNFHEASRFRSEASRFRSERFRSEVVREEELGNEHRSSDSEGAGSSDEFVSPADFPSLAGDMTQQSDSTSSRVIGSWAQHTPATPQKHDAFPSLGGTPADGAVLMAQPQWCRPRHPTTHYSSEPAVEHTDRNPSFHNDTSAFPSLDGHIAPASQQRPVNTKSWSKAILTKQPTTQKHTRREKGPSKPKVPDLIQDFPSLSAH